MTMNRKNNIKKSLQKFNTELELIQHAYNLWIKIATNSITDHGYFTVALSGGNSPIGFYRYLAKHVDASLWKKTHIFQVDERFVPQDHPDSNFRSLNENLFLPAKIPAANIHAIPTDMLADVAVKSYRQEIDDFFRSQSNLQQQNNLRQSISSQQAPSIQQEDNSQQEINFQSTTKSQHPEFDLIMLGVGEDGHAASIFPNHSEQINATETVILSSTNAAKHQRITLTLPLINQAKNVIFVVVGKNKAEILQQIVTDNTCNLPAALVQPKHGSLLFLFCAKK